MFVGLFSLALKVSMCLASLVDKHIKLSKIEYVEFKNMFTQFIGQCAKTEY